MNINQLEYLVATVRHGSCSRAAKELFVAPSTVSKSIGDLEREIKTELLMKCGRGICPTEFASLLADRAELVLEQYSDFKYFALSSNKENGVLSHFSLGVSASHRGMVFMTMTSLTFRTEIVIRI